ncbi:hypothetical protein E3Q22_01213 [Wallemia mellicola]|uniref:BED-type domain-containing protein n=1 Tax=Wallemia mellicola TaxID=1708541 RepID=A0A4V4N4M6_9BASI|nr:hypothetical protein E3Q23_00691 [Wallemia mellicola]TIB81301.1 hypothetical protein E3Q22_01213 [Wallemia mellicola]TIC04008.1 hypothetical protein E3Q17_00774 [Wallemia mellicola]TIC06900.1 hypothetical protein E3Q16_00777 [Wallemia mellicola]TIC45689.1 hypothetical protein E3Q08_01126 [Wallemia mellicola]
MEEINPYLDEIYRSNGLIYSDLEQTGESPSSRSNPSTSKQSIEPKQSNKEMSYPCEYCDKCYSGKHGRSILRRHLSEKHDIPLRDQPRRSRWDTDSRRPKSEQERRDRMLASKRRWAFKKRHGKSKEDVQQEVETMNKYENASTTSNTSFTSDIPSTYNQSLTPKRVKVEEENEDDYPTTLPPLIYPTNAPPSIPRFEVFKEESTPFKLPSITPFRQSSTHNFFANTPPSTLFKDKGNLQMSSPANPDLASKLGLAPTPKNDMFSLNNYQETPVKIRSKVPSLKELTTPNNNK